MDRIFNQFSFIIVGLVVLAAAALMLSRRGFSLPKKLLLAVLTLILLVAWVVSHPSGLPGKTADQISSRIGGGQPVLLEFLSPY